MNVTETDKKYIENTYARFPVQIVKGEGSLCYDETGKEYVDMGSGIAVNTFGFCDGGWVKAVTEQLTKFQHTSNLYYQQPCADIAKVLCERTGMEKIFFSNSGAEANECAVKCARKYASDKKGKEFYNIITLKNSFHGRTITTLAATGQDVFHKDFNPLTEGFLYAEAGDLDGVKKLLSEHKTAAIMFEVIQGEGGVNALEKGFVQELSRLAEKENVLLICDEVQTGNGRTGKLYGYMNYGIEPDIVTTAKWLAGGLPFAATMFGKRVAGTLSAGTHGSTFGGNPVAAAGALYVLGRLTEDFLSEVTKKSEYIIRSLSGVKGVKSISGAGLMLGIETEAPAREIVMKCIGEGALFLTAKNKVRLLPALNISYELIDRALSVFKKVLEGLL